MRRKPRNDSYKSNFERDVHEFFGKQVTYEPDRINFTQPAVERTYNPDFKVKKNVYIETKGKLSLDDRKKHLWIKEQHPEITIIFLFINSQNKLTRKSNTSYQMWAEENGFHWYCWRIKKPPQKIKELLTECTSAKLLKLVMEPSSSKGNSRRKNTPSSLNTLSKVLSNEG